MVNNLSKVNDLLSSPDQLEANDLLILEKSIEEFPWFQPARSVYLKGLHNESSPLYNKELQITATHTGDRGVLFDFITSPVFIQNRISEQIKKQQEHLKEIPVEAETLEIKEEDLNSSIDFKNTLDTDLFERPTVAINKEPIQFDKNETYSFAEWLKLTKLQPINREEDDQDVLQLDHPVVPLNDDRAEKMAIIDQFLADKPKIKPRKDRSAHLNIADHHRPADQLMTETLAQVYLAQNNYAKAIQAYEILVLHHPEKSGFFADRIREIKNLQSNI